MLPPRSQTTTAKYYTRRYPQYPVWHSIYSMNSGNHAAHGTPLLESLIPSYGSIHKLATYTLGFDATFLLSLGAALWVIAKVCRSIWTRLYLFLLNHCVSQISVYSTDEIHDHLLSFFAEHVHRNSRKIIAETRPRSTWDLVIECTGALQSTPHDGGHTLLNFSNQTAKSQPRFTPALGSHFIHFEGRYFQLRRQEVGLFENMSNGAANFKNKELLTLSCLGRSSEPLKQFIQYAKAHNRLGRDVQTIVKRPASKDLRRFGSRWMKAAERPCRPMETVVLDEDCKSKVLHDINEYLHPATAKWYADRGIPYRRGYLFHGPPGTGKTSLTFALAGVFGLDIHVISLSEPTLTEEELETLLTNLPARCIVLLDDIDAAGLRREPGGSKWRTSQQAITDEERRNGISLSGLLNAVDGVASHEGHVLIINTNHPENLDEALIRPGRIDYKIAFGNATEKQVEELFERMYANDSSPELNSVQPSATSKGTKEIDGEPTELRVLAIEFAKEVGDKVFSPAEIQGFLLGRKKDPKKAVKEVGAWVDSCR